MGLFSFLKKGGEKIKTNDGNDFADLVGDFASKQKADLLKGMVESMGIGVEISEIDFDGDKVVVHGTAETNEGREKAILAIGNIDGVEHVEDHIKVEQTEEERIKSESQFHTVKSGESLSLIAKHYYGDAMKYPVIFEANKPMLKDANLIYVGQVLRIPAL